MLTIAFAKLKERKYLIEVFVFFAIFSILYGIIDYLNLPYPEMATTYGTGLVVLNVFLNLLMASGSSLLMTLGTINLRIKGREGKGESLGFLSILFGMLTYGCTSCVVSFFAAIGIAFSVVALPLAGLPYKLISLVMVLAGLTWMILEIHHGKCRLPKAK
jgi:hypothetical protein